MRTSANEELGTLAENNPLAGYEPNLRAFIQESSSDSRPSNLHDLEIDDYTIGRALSSPLFTQEREDPASRRHACHSLDEGLSSSQSLSVGHVTTVRPVDEFGSLFQASEKIHVATQKMSKPGFFWNDKKSRFWLIDYRAEIQKHEFQADYDRRNIQKLHGVIESQRGEIYRAHQGDEQHRRDQQLLHEQLLEQNRDLRGDGRIEAKRFQGSTVDTISRRKLVEDRDTRFRNYRMKLIA